jgi:flagellar biosynthesis/type III secretory pathway protein FliH
MEGALAITGKVLKVDVGGEPVRVRDPRNVIAEARTTADEIIQEAQRAGERIRKGAFQGAEKERQTARTDAARIMREASDQRDALIRETLEQTGKRVREEVLQEFRPRIEKATAAFEEVVRSAEENLTSFLEIHKEEVVQLSLAIAERIVQKISNEDRVLVLRTVVNALQKAADREKVTIRIHPEDVGMLSEFKLDLMSRFEDLKVIGIEADPRVDRGGALVESPSGLVDARIRTQLEEMMRAVLPNAE